MVDQHRLLTDIEKSRNTLQTDKLDMSFGEIMSMYERGEIIINPDFQRLYRWSDYQKTRFIESVIIGIPIPPVFVAEDDSGRWELVDGLQRLSTIFSFFGNLNGDGVENKWVLGAGDMLQTLDGYNVDTLPLKIQLNIKRAVCRVEIIKWNSEYDLRFELFKLKTHKCAKQCITNVNIDICVNRKYCNFLYICNNYLYIVIINRYEKDIIITNSHNGFVFQPLG